MAKAVKRFLRRQSERDAMRRAFATADGQVALRVLVREARVFQGGFNPDARAAAFNEGARGLALWLLDELNMTSERERDLHEAARAEEARHAAGD